jgi:hypothetical protein
MNLARMVRTATTGWSGALVAMMHHGARLSSSWAVRAPTSIQPLLPTQQLYVYRLDILSDPVWIMRLLECNNDSAFSLTKDFVGGEIPEYAIHSHT